VPYARPLGGNVSKSTVGDVGWSSPFPPVMKCEVLSSSDAAGAGGRAGVTAPAPLPVPSGAAPGPGEAAASHGRGHPQRRKHPWVLRLVASHVNLEHLVSRDGQRSPPALRGQCGRGEVLVIADGGNPARSRWEGRPRCRQQVAARRPLSLASLGRLSLRERVDTLDRLLDKCMAS
jgi:hypothetical protein